MVAMDSSILEAVRDVLAGTSLGGGASLVIPVMTGVPGEYAPCAWLPALEALGYPRERQGWGWRTAWPKNAGESARAIQRAHAKELAWRGRDRVHHVIVVETPEAATQLALRLREGLTEREVSRLATTLARRRRNRSSRAYHGVWTHPSVTHPVPRQVSRPHAALLAQQLLAQVMPHQLLGVGGAGDVTTRGVRGIVIPQLASEVVVPAALVSWLAGAGAAAIVRGSSTLPEAVRELYDRLHPSEGGAHQALVAEAARAFGVKVSAAYKEAAAHLCREAWFPQMLWTASLYAVSAVHQMQYRAVTARQRDDDTIWLRTGSVLRLYNERACPGAPLATAYLVLPHCAAAFAGALSLPRKLHEAVVTQAAGRLRLVEDGDGILRQPGVRHFVAEAYMPHVAWPGLGPDYFDAAQGWETAEQRRMVGSWLDILGMQRRMGPLAPRGPLAFTAGKTPDGWQATDAAENVVAAQARQASAEPLSWDGGVPQAVRRETERIRTLGVATSDDGAWRGTVALLEVCGWLPYYTDAPCVPTLRDLDPDDTDVAASWASHATAARVPLPAVAVKAVAAWEGTWRNTGRALRPCSVRRAPLPVVALAGWRSAPRGGRWTPGRPVLAYGYAEASVYGGLPTTRNWAAWTAGTINAYHHWWARVGSFNTWAAGGGPFRDAYKTFVLQDGVVRRWADVVWSPIPALAAVYGGLSVPDEARVEATARMAARGCTARRYGYELPLRPAEYGHRGVAEVYATAGDPHADLWHEGEPQPERGVVPPLTEVGVALLWSPPLADD